MARTLGNFGTSSGFSAARSQPPNGRVNELDLGDNLRKYLEDRWPNERYASFDYCFNYFQSFREAGAIPALASPANLQVSALQLGFYLASWGMLRGSAELLQKSAKYLVPVVEVISCTKVSVWEIDADSYNESNVQHVCELARTIRCAYPAMSDTLVTKIMLGVFGNVPAFDTNFKRGFGVSTFGPKALRKVGCFFRDNAAVIDAHRVKTLDFISGDQTHRRYTRAKVIDMAFFIEGMARTTSAPVVG